MPYSSSPSPALTKATTDVLEFFARQFPRVNTLKGWSKSPEARAELISTWSRALMQHSVTIGAVMDAAHRWMADPQHIVDNARTLIPTAASFGKYARDVDRQYHRAHQPSGPRPTNLPGRAHDLGKRAYAVLKSWPAVMLVNDELLKLAPDAAAMKRIRENRVGLQPTDPWPRLEHYDQAVEIVRAKLERRAAKDAAQRKAG